METLIKKIDGYIKEFDLNKKCRKQIYVHRRMYISYILRRNGFTFRSIGDMLNLDHSTIMWNIKQYKMLKSMKDPILLRDISVFDLRVYNNQKYNLKEDICKATTIRDLEIIKERTEKKLYKELIY